MDIWVTSVNDRAAQVAATKKLPVGRYTAVRGPVVCTGPRTCPNGRAVHLVHNFRGARRSVTYGAGMFLVEIRLADWRVPPGWVVVNQVATKTRSTYVT